MWRRVRAGNLFRVIWAAAGFGLLAFMCAAQTAPAQRHSAAEAGQRGVFLVFPFENTGGDGHLDWLGEGLEELTVQRLAAAGQQVFTHEGRSAQLERYGLPASAKLSRASILRLAEDLDADYVVFGSYASDGKKLSVVGRLLRVSPAALLPAVRESGPLETLMELHTRAVWRLLSSSAPGLPPSLGEFSRAQRALRLDAFEHYIRGRLATEDEPRMRELREAVRLEPDWPDPAFALGRAFFARRDCASALSWFGRVPKTHDRYLEAVFSTGVCHLWTNQPERAEGVFLALQESLKKSAGAAGDLPEILNNLAVARVRSGKAAAAQGDLLRAAELDPDDDDYPFNLGLLALRAEDFAGAVARFREAAGREPDDANARALLIYALERGGAKAEADAARAAGPSRGEPLPAVRAETLPRLDRVKTELDTTVLRQEMAEAAAPAASASGSAAHVRAGRQQLSAGHLPEAESEFRAALAADPRDPATHRGLAEIARRAGRLEEAAAELRASLESRDSAIVRTALARIYLEQKKTEAARQELEKALKLAPNYAEAKQLLQRIEAANPGATR